MLYDIAIIGAGPAGLSAALTAMRRKKTVIIFDPYETSPKLGKAHLIDNYLGIPDVSGRELMTIFKNHVLKTETVFVKEKINNIYPGDEFTLTTATNVYTSKTVVFAVGSSLGTTYPGEVEFLGRGVSYCATCDGQFFQNKKIAVIATMSEAKEEIAFLAQICSEIYFFPLYKGEYIKKENIKIINERPKTIIGNETVSELITDKNSYSLDGVFIFRESEPPGHIVDGIELRDNAVKVDSFMKTNIAGLFAAGDVIGKPWQIAKATGEGQIAVLSAIAYLDK